MLSGQQPVPSKAIRILRYVTFYALAAGGAQMLFGEKPGNVTTGDIMPDSPHTEILTCCCTDDSGITEFDDSAAFRLSVEYISTDFPLSYYR